MFVYLINERTRTRFPVRLIKRTNTNNALVRLFMFVNVRICSFNYVRPYSIIDWIEIELPKKPVKAGKSSSKSNEKGNKSTPQKFKGRPKSQPKSQAQKSKTQPKPQPETAPEVAEVDKVEEVKDKRGML
ncbi:hypothetical protein LXL04_015542 [Taraxacum kok-saghyz]